LSTAVIALGKIGLPLAVQISSKGWRVLGADISEKVVESVNDGKAPFPGEEGLDSLLAEVVNSGLLTATTDTTAVVGESENVVVVVPLMTDRDGVADFRAMDAATADIARGLQPGTLVSYETTLPVGSTRLRFQEALESATGLTAGSDFYLVHSPERVFSGRIFRDLRRYPKLVGGVDEASTQRGVEFYSKILDFDDRPDLERPNGVWAMASAEAAEMAKLAETTYRDVNIALANEFARFAEGVNVNVAEVIEASNSQPFSHIHRPGIAVGGHCIPVYPRFYLAGDPGAAVVETARRVNSEVPARVVRTVSESLGGLSGRRVLILGAAYRGGVKETAYSGVFDLRDEIARLGGTALVSDPLYDHDELLALDLRPWDGDDVDVLIVQADHSEYQTLNPAAVPGVRLAYDGRGILDASAWEKAGVTVFVIGQGLTAS
jgi:nucleotide sugar dehydrogenase